MSTTDPTKAHVLAKGKQSISLIEHPPCYSYVNKCCKDTTLWQPTQITNKTLALLQTTDGKDEPNIVLCPNHN